MQHGILRANFMRTEFYGAAKSGLCRSAPFRAKVASDLAYQNACEDERRA